MAGRMTSLMNLPMDVELDTTFRYADHIPAFDIGSYHEMDLRLGWKPKGGLELSIAGRNLLDSGHEEFRGSGGFEIPSSDIERSV
jgi:iron complex outermembrane receptor protein